nr:immunoglobulin light chain junction region [Macaca mulatta]MOV86054.1 immunoglobulin light chain junction region [Macaca mulatta]
CQQSYTYPWTF